MPKPFYSRTDADLATGADNLIAIVAPVPATWGLTTGEVTSYTSLSDDYATKLSSATTPNTRTSVAVAAKDIAKKLLKAASVNVARTITAVPTVTNAQLVELGLNERIIPQPRPVPAIPPVLEVTSVAGRIINLRIHSADSEGRAKPFGAIGANLYTFVGDSAPTDPRVYHYEGMATRSKTSVILPDSVPSGATVWLSGCWMSQRGQMSTGSVPISTSIQGGNVPAAA